MPPSAHDTIEIDGSLGLETNVSHHSGDPKSFRTFLNLVTDTSGRFAKRDGRGSAYGAFGTEVQYLWEYAFIDPTNGVETYHVLAGVGTHIYLWDGAMSWADQTLPITPTAGARWGMYTAANCVLAFNGKDALLIGEQPSFRLLSLTRVTTTATATTIVPHNLITGDVVTITGAVAANYNVTAVITVTGASTFTYPVTNAGVTPDLGSPIVASALTTIRWRIAGVDAPSFAPTYSVNAQDPAVTDGTTGHTVTGTQGSTTIVAAGAAFTTGAAWNGKHQVINGNGYTILSVTDSTHLEITEGFKEVTAPLLPWTVYPGIGAWDDIAPQYRFSYFNPTTGHVSNPSPAVQVTETFQQGRTLRVTIPASTENQTAFLNGYTQIQLFRSPKNAGIMVALNEKLTNVNSAVTTIVYNETLAKFADTFLTDFQAPLRNFKPPAGISSVVFQQGRGFAVHRPSGHVRFTPVGVEVDFGRAIECWPPLYQLEIAAPRGLLVVGGQSSADSLVVQTEGGDFSIDGFNSITFSPYRLPTRRSGSYPGAAVDVDGQLVEFYADKRLMVLRKDVAQRIQDRLNLVKPSLITSVRLHWFSSGSRNYLFLSIPKNSGSTANDYTYVFDLDLGGGPIYEWSFGVSAFATIHDATTAALQLMIGDAAGAINILFSGDHQDTGVNFAPTFTTGWFRGDELRKELKYVKLFVNDAQLGAAPLTGWTGVLYINEQNDPAAVNGEAVPMTFRQMDYRAQSAQGRELIWTPTVELRTKSKVFQVAITYPNVNADLSIEKMIIGSDLDQELGIGALSGKPVLGGQQA